MFAVKAVVSVIVFLSLFAVILAAVALVSFGLLAVPLSLLVMTGLFTSVASDVSTASVFLAGVSCLSGGFALGLTAVKLFPKQVRLFKRNVKS